MVGRFLLCMVFVALVAGSARASGYTSLNAGIDARARGEAKTAITYLTAAISAPDLPTGLKPVAFLDRAGMYDAIGQSGAALADYTVAIGLRPDYLLAYLKRSKLYESKGNCESAAADMTHAVALRPHRPDIRSRRADLYLRCGETDKALADGNELVREGPNDFSEHLERGKIYRRMARYGDAIADESVAIRLYDRYGPAYAERAESHFLSGQPDKAVDDYEEAIDLGQRYFLLYWYEGISYWELGRRSDAVESFEEAAKFAPNDGYLVMWLAIVGSLNAADSLNRFAGGTRATKWPGQLVAVYAGKSPASGALAAASRAEGREKEARQCLAQFYLGEWKLLQGDTSGARTLIGAAATGCPARFAESVAARNQMRRLQ